MATEEPSRREQLAIRALDPVAGGETIVYFSHERLQEIGRRSKGQILEAAELVPQALQCGGPVFEGFLDDSDEPRRGKGWRCYCCLPDRSYSEDGDRCRPRKDRVFPVFVNEDRVAYNWRWEKADPDEAGIPIGHARRFKRRLA